eukprot:CAMPEP_0172925622 /NCGR_PEP_ID=MMETSP1075-20121228/214074_1 /TAXON_ID=2916 /ORGANISM="Ceratium fusus, Strain PA161109" /LENGTH=42 /DNA_ID= /DNA_START= /DNA_END= /DNA_ORIENTATION=
MESLANGHIDRGTPNADGFYAGIASSTRECKGGNARRPLNSA